MGKKTNKREKKQTKKKKHKSYQYIYKYATVHNRIFSDIRSGPFHSSSF